MKSYLKEKILEALPILGINPPKHDIQLERPKQPDHGDISTNISLVLAKQEKTNPRKIAEKLVESMMLDDAMVSAVEIAGPGFINFRYATQYIYKELLHILSSGNEYGRNTVNRGKRVNVEWVSANPTGPLHAGHGRQVCLGATLCSLLEWSGWEVTREYYFNNAGNQMNKLGLSVRERYKEFLGVANETEKLHYAGEYIYDIAKQIYDDYGDSKFKAKLDYFTAQGEQYCFQRIKETLSMLSVKHDIFFNEDTLYSDGKIDEVLTILREKNLAYEKDGAVWFRTTEFGADKDRVIVKNSGEPTYRLPDIAYHKNKIERGYDRLIDIFGADHIATIPDVLAGVRSLGYPTEHIDVVIHQMVSFVKDGEAVKMSKRSGNVYYLEDLISDVGIDAVRYFFVMRSANSHLEFDLALAQEQSEKNPVYYVQYAHARIASLIRFAESENIDCRAQVNFTLLKDESEVLLIKKLIEFPELVLLLASTYETQQLCTYLNAVATAFHKFYHDCRVVTDDLSLTQARISLCIATKQVLANGFAIVGISALEKM